jgi:hypothetical protein
MACNQESAMSKLTLEPPSDSDATVAARHLCVLLATERPDLWPALNAASLGRNGGGGGVDWPDVLRQMEVAHQGEVTA